MISVLPQGGPITLRFWLHSIVKLQNFGKYFVSHSEDNASRLTCFWYPSLSLFVMNYAFRLLTTIGKVFKNCNLHICLPTYLKFNSKNIHLVNTSRICIFINLYPLSDQLYFLKDLHEIQSYFTSQSLLLHVSLTMQFIAHVILY